MIVLGCGGSKPAPTPGPAAPEAKPATADLRARCVTAIGKAAATGRGDEKFSATDRMVSADVEKAMIDGCGETKWPDVALVCLTKGTSREELRGCTELLTPVQREDLMERVLAVAKAHEAAEKPAP